MGGGKRDEAEEEKISFVKLSEFKVKDMTKANIFAKSWFCDEYQVDFIDVPAAEVDEDGCDTDADVDADADADDADADDAESDDADADDDGDDPPDKSSRGLIALPRGHTSTAVAMHLEAFEKTLAKCR